MMPLFEKTPMRIVCIAGLLGGLCNPVAFAQWHQQTVPTDANFRGLCLVSPNVVWVSGTKGTYAKTADGGTTWVVSTVPGAAKLDFRDVEAFSDATAYLLSAGPGEDSRIYKTLDGGRSWILQFKNPEREGFFDAIAFRDESHGLALSDPVNGRFRLVTTDDGGSHWKRLDAPALPPALPNEGAFAASGTCLVTRGDGDAWFATGGAKYGRVFHSRDRGRTWTVSNTPIAAGSPSAGIFSIAFRDRNHGVIVGGDYRKPSEPGRNAAVTSDAGKTWTSIATPLPYRSGVAWGNNCWIAVGTSGSDISRDDGRSWKTLDRENYNSVALPATGEGWAVGPRGRIAKLAN
jgi:photosystem II stability/assembly factor-like uncharacterized protein